jgi:hypothetical protein
MLIILEGPDGGGKTTLVKELIRLLPNYNYVNSGGPEKYPGEINERCARYAQYIGNYIFDRHPCVSQVAYRLIHEQTMPDARWIEEFYNSGVFIIYCRPPTIDVTHTATGEWDTPDYIAAINAKYPALLEWYDNWAVRRANHIYRIGDDVIDLANYIRNL